MEALLEWVGGLSIHRFSELERRVVISLPPVEETMRIGEDSSFTFPCPSNLMHSLGSTPRLSFLYYPACGFARPEQSSVVVWEHE